MPEEFELNQGKTAGDLGKEALWFFTYTILSILVLALVVIGIGVTRPDIDAAGPKILGTVLALLVPMMVGFIVARVQHNLIAKYIWIAGLLFFAIVCVWVLDLPTGPGLCEKCGALEKLWRTFFDFNHGSGLMGGDGLLVGTWMPLSMIGFALGARLGLND